MCARGLEAAPLSVTIVCSIFQFVLRSIEPLRQSIRQFLTAFRAAHGMKQDNLAEILGVSQQCVSQWEAGRRTPPPKTVARIKDVLISEATEKEQFFIDLVARSDNQVLNAPNAVRLSISPNVLRHLGEPTGENASGVGHPSFHAHRERSHERGFYDGKVAKNMAVGIFPNGRKILSVSLPVYLPTFGWVSLASIFALNDREYHDRLSQMGDDGFLSFGPDGRAMAAPTFFTPGMWE